MPIGFGAAELLVILAILLLLFGASRVADLGSGLGKSIREFKKAAAEEDAPPAVKAESKS